MERWGIRFGKLVPKVKPKDRIQRWRILKGDIVEVCSGKFDGAQGKVIEVVRKQNRVVIEGLNTVRKTHEGQTYNVEQGIPAFRLALLDPEKKVPTKVRYGWVEDKDGEYRKVRISKLTGLEIPKPPPPVRDRQAGQFDTKPEDALRITFTPSLEVSPIPDGCML